MDRFLASSLAVLVIPVTVMLAVLIGDYIISSRKKLERLEHRFCGTRMQKKWFEKKLKQNLDQRKIDYCEGCMKAYLACGRTGNLSCAETGYCDAVKKWTE